MPQFIGRPNLPNIQTPVIPSKDEQIFNAISSLLGKFTEHNLDISKAREKMKSESAATKFVQDALTLRSKQENLAETIKSLLGKGYSIGTKMEGPLAQGQTPESMISAQPGGAINMADLEKMLSGKDPTKFLVPPKEDVAKKQIKELGVKSKELDLQIKKARLTALGKGKDKETGIPTLIRLRGQYVGQFNNLATDAPDREAYQASIGKIDKILKDAGIPVDDLLINLPDARRAVREGKIDEIKAQEMLSKEYPGLSPVFSKKEEGGIQKLLEAFGIGGE